MKFKNKIVYGLVLGAFALASCQKDEDGPTISGDSLTVDREEILVGPDRIHETVLVTASDDLEWVTSSSRFFVSTTPANGTGSAEVTFVIDSTLEAGSRTAQVRIMNRNDESERKIINITQFGYGKQILPRKPEVQIESSASYDDRYIDATITTNVAFEVDPAVEYELGEELTPEDQASLSESDLKNWIRMDGIKIPSAEEQNAELDSKDRPRVGSTSGFRGR